MTTESVPAPHTARETAAAPGKTTAAAPGRTVAAPARRPAPRTGPAGLIAADVLAPLLTWALLAPPAPPAPLAAALLPLALLQPALYACRGLYRPRLVPSAFAEIPTVAGLALLQWLILAEGLRFLGHGGALAPAAALLAAALHTVLCCAARAMAHRGARRAAAHRPRSALVIGDGPIARQVTGALQGHPEYGMRPVARIRVPAPDGPAPGEPPRAPAPHTGAPVTVVTARQEGSPAPPVLTTPQEVERTVVRDGVGDAFFTHDPGPAPDPRAAALIGLLTRHGCRLWLVDGGAAAGSWWRAGGHDHVWGFAVLPLRDGPYRPLGRAVKRVLDILLAAVALVLAAPVLAACALAVRIADGPGVVFRQERVGLHGRPFTLLKFRTLCPVDESESATRWNVAFDRRMSATGHLLRRTSLDELPQLWNVLRGDMSLVGPRPERPYFVSRFSRAHPGYQARHRMPVGVTGLAQIHGLRGDTSIEERARFDNLYIDTWTPWQDVRIIARTAVSLFRLGGS
ncbi:exopolysaccharide biosynthesis polyprenyl glycosylphosphotransferase [Streptomyces sp. NPDC000594]|uniref:exopolysaccharide biosynthesis polyprenyl glycosylphosphotransferase n=1 Tax=Streptomyces sp. NPDC000594 TaxID=3154261 RepID=UPI003318E873